MKSAKVFEKKILVVEDDPDIRELILYNLRRDGYNAIVAITGEEGMTKAQEYVPDLILLDIMLPGIDGVEVCRRLRLVNETVNIPIIMLTAKSDEQDIVSALNMGADDYIIKPFSPRILLARIESRLRATSTVSDESDAVDLYGLEIDPRSYEVRIDGKRINLTLTEFRILFLLVKSPGWVFSRDEIIDKVHGRDVVVTDRSVDVQISGLRQKLGRFRDGLETMRGVGYRFRVPVD